MANISDIIEEFIKSVIGQEESLQLSRNELANYFSVAPSQINYVLHTRFNVDKGYVVESRRGGGGYITILRVSTNQEETIPAMLAFLDQLNELTYKKACDMLEKLEYQKIINNEELNIIKSAISDKALVGPLLAKGLRKNIFKEILIGLMRR